MLFIITPKVGEPVTTSNIELTEKFREALNRLEVGENLFLTGKAGTGKSTLIREFIARTDRNVVVTAPTGIAALNVQGYTLHRLFSLHPSSTTLEQVRSGSYFPGRFSKVIKELETLIVDEASMVRADLFDMIALALQRFGPHPGQPFGGVQIVLVGDLMQLPPVVTEAEQNYFETTYQTPYFFSAEHYSKDRFPTVALTKNFRQRGDDQMTSILNAIRDGVLLGTAAEDLAARVAPHFQPADDEFWLTVTTTNRIAGARNRERLNRLPDKLHQHQGVTTGSTENFDFPTEQVLEYKVGAQIMLLTNDPANRWVNGTFGRLVGVGTTEEGDTRVSIDLRDSAEEGPELVDVFPHTWEITEPMIEGGTLKHRVVGTFTQLPFKLAWAITVHKSQGQTVNRLIVDLSGGAFAFGQLYVALSRVTSLQGLVLKRPVKPRDLKTDRRVRRFLRSAAASSSAPRFCALEVLTVGDEGRLSRPRPIEIAVAFSDGSAITSLINPQRDTADARSSYGISAPDVLLAPTLTQAWVVLAPALAGFTPVGTSIDHTLGVIDYELKRLGQITPLPLGIEVPPLTSPPGDASRTALQRAMKTLESFTAQRIQEDQAMPFEDTSASTDELGFLISRHADAPTPNYPHLPGLEALLDVCREVSPTLLGQPPAKPTDDALAPDSWHAAARRGLAEQLQHRASESTLAPEAVRRLEQAGRMLGHPLSFPETASPENKVQRLLAEGTRVCFTGTALDSSDKPWSRQDMEALAKKAGLEPVSSVTKTRCEVLVVAELGSQSGKAKKARDYEKPIISAGEFFAWAGL